MLKLHLKLARRTKTDFISGLKHISTVKFGVYYVDLTLELLGSNSCFSFKTVYWAVE